MGSIIKDEDGTDIDYSVDNLIQIAVRNNRTIRISDNYMSKMNSGNLAALIFHEAIYAIIPPEYRSGNKLSEVIIENDGRRREVYEEYTFLKQPSRPVRDVVSYLFSDDFENNPETLLNISEGYLPMYSDRERGKAKGKNIFYFDENVFLTNPTVQIHPRTDTSTFITSKSDANNTDYMNSLLESVCTGREYITLYYKFKRFALKFATFNGEDSAKNSYLQIDTDTYFYKYDKYFDLKNSFYQSSFHSSPRYNESQELRKCKDGIKEEVSKYFNFFRKVKDE